MSVTNTTPAVPELQITEHDMRRLRDVVDNYASGNLAEAAEALEWELDRAHVVQEQVPKDVVTMHSRVVCEDMTTGKRHEITIVYPTEADAESGKVSVLAPMGVALIGMSVDDTIDWQLPRGRTTRLKVVDVQFQPEAAGAA